MAVSNLYEIASLQSLMSDFTCIIMRAKIEYSVHTVNWLHIQSRPKDHDNVAGRHSVYHNVQVFFYSKTRVLNIAILLVLFAQLSCKNTT